MEIPDRSNYPEQVKRALEKYDAEQRAKDAEREALACTRPRRIPARHGEVSSNRCLPSPPRRFQVSGSLGREGDSGRGA